MKVLVLGATGFIGRRIVAAAEQRNSLSLRLLSRKGKPDGGAHEWVQGDAQNTEDLSKALQGCQAVVSCVTGNAHNIVQCGRALVEALRQHPGLRVVHLSSMAVFGDVEGDVHDNHPPGSGGGWYADAKREAERQVLPLATKGHPLTILRPGCVHGPGSPLWVGRVAAWLEQRRMGDLGEQGDGWSNLVHVDDVSRAVVAALDWTGAAGEALFVNLAAPDSPRWNRYLIDMGVALGATPVRRIPPWQLKVDATLAAVPLRVWERVAPRAGIGPRWIPPAVTPAVLALFRQHRRLHSHAAVRELRLVWTPYKQSLQECVHWYFTRVRGMDDAGVSSVMGGISK